MKGIIDETGRRYGRLTVLERADMPHMKGAWWLCRCDCGAVFPAEGHKLRSGNTRSCGCLREEVSRERMTERWRKYRERA